MLKFSPANRKLQKLAMVKDIAPYLANKRKVYSFDLLAGHTCPFADKCLSKVIVNNEGKLRVVDGPDTQFRCYAASLEAYYPQVYNQHKHNTDMLKGKDTDTIFALLNDSLPKNAGVIRIHSSGDFFSAAYFRAWVKLAKSRPDILFYAYTKNLPVWVNNQKNIPDNMILTASYGGKADALVTQYKLRNVTVVLSESVASNLDEDDSHAANPALRNESFQLLIHGVQPANTEAAKAVYKINRGIKS